MISSSSFARGTRGVGWRPSNLIIRLLNTSCVWCLREGVDSRDWSINPNRPDVAFCIRCGQPRTVF